jgi:histone-binding protein RBBP4
LEKEYPVSVSNNNAINIHAGFAVVQKWLTYSLLLSLSLSLSLPYLLTRYDTVMTHSLEWPSLTCQWLPTVKNAGPNSYEHSLLLGTHTAADEQNYLMVASCNLPKDDAVIDNRIDKENDKNDNEVEVAGDAAASKAAAESKAASAYNEEKKEVGGFGHASSTTGIIEIRMKVKHEGEVNRARYMPQNHFFVATRGPGPELFVFDLSKHPSFPTEESVFSPQVVCCGHAQEGYAMAWSKLKEGHLLSGSEDTTVCLFDINSGASKSTEKTGRQVTPLATFRGHTKGVEDVDWHCKDPNMIASVSDDLTIRLWDTRSPEKAIHVVESGHTKDINSVAFNPINEFLFATGSSDSTVALWDIRNLKSRTQTLSGHTDEVFMIDWAPFNESILASCSADRRVGIWDLSRIGMEQSPEDAEDGPPELLFLHGGHTSNVSDFSWNAADPWTLASVSEDNVLQVWHMAEEIYAGGDEEEDSSGEGEDKLLGDDDLE